MVKFHVTTLIIITCYYYSGTVAFLYLRWTVSLKFVISYSLSKIMCKIEYYNNMVCLSPLFFLAFDHKASTITAPTFSRSFKEWKFCMHEVQVAQGFSWMECPACSLDQHSCHVDGNMKLYRYKSSGK